MLFDDLDRISNMIAVAMRAEQNIDVLHFFLERRTGWIIHDPGIDNDDFPARSNNTKCRVAKPRKLNALKIHS